MCFQYSHLKYFESGIFFPCLQFILLSPYHVYLRPMSRTVLHSFQNDGRLPLASATKSRFVSVPDAGKQIYTKVVSKTTLRWYQFLLLRTVNPVPPAAIFLPVGCKGDSLGSEFVWRGSILIHRNLVFTVPPSPALPVN